MKHNSKVKQIKYSRLNELEKHFLEIIEDIEIRDNYYVKNSEILFELRKSYVYFNRKIYSTLYMLYDDIYIENKNIDEFNDFIRLYFKNHLNITIKVVLGVNSSIQDYWDTKVFL